MGSPCSHRGPASSLISFPVPAAGVYALDDVKVLAPPPLLVVALPYAIAVASVRPRWWRKGEQLWYNEGGDNDGLLSSTPTTV